MSQNPVSPEEAVEALRGFVLAEREVYFAEYPPLPAGVTYAAEVSGLLVLAKDEEENLFLDVLLGEDAQAELVNLPAAQVGKLAQILRDQRAILGGLMSSYELLESILSAYAGVEVSDVAG